MNTKVNLNVKFTVEGPWSSQKTAVINRFIRENFKLCSEVITGVETEKILNNPSKTKKKKVKKPKEEPKQEVKPAVAEKPKQEAKPVLSDEDQKILDRIINCVKEVDYHSEVTQDTHFQNDLGFDSLDAIELVMKLEDEFEIEIFDNEAEALYDKTVKDVFKFIKEKLDEKEKGK